MKKVFKSRIFIFIATAILFTGIGVYAGTTYPYQASDVAYTPSDGETINVNEALNEIYNIKTLGNATASDILQGKTAVVQGKLITGTKTINNNGYVALFNGSASITNTTVNLSLSYFNTAYGVKNSNTTITLNTPGTYRIIGTVSHSPITGIGYTTTTNVYVNGSQVGYAVNNYFQYGIINYSFVINSGQTYRINTTLYSDGAVEKGMRGGMVVIIKTA